MTTPPLTFTLTQHQTFGVFLCPSHAVPYLYPLFFGPATLPTAHNQRLVLLLAERVFVTFVMIFSPTDRGRIGPAPRLLPPLHLQLCAAYRVGYWSGLGLGLGSGLGSELQPYLISFFASCRATIC